MPSSFFVHGEKGIGKTALVKLIKNVSSARDKDLYNLNLLTSYYSVEENQDISSVLQESVNKLTDSVDEGVLKKIGGKVGSLFKNGKFEIGAYGTHLGIETKEDITQKEISIKDQTVGILSNLIEEIDNAQGEKKDGILIIIDEVHNLKNLKSVASILRNIVTTLDVEEKGKISFILVGYDEDVEVFFSNDSSSRRIFDSIPLGVMPDTEAVEILDKGFKVAEVTSDTISLNKNISAAGGYPHSIQILGQYLIENDMDDYIDQKDWDKSLIDATFDLKTKEFSTMYSFENSKETACDKILVALAKSGMDRPLTKIELKRQVGKNIYQYLPKLKKIGAVKEIDKKITLQSQLLRTAILVDQLIKNNKNKKLSKDAP